MSDFLDILLEAQKKKVLIRSNPDDGDDDTDYTDGSSDDTDQGDKDKDQDDTTNSDDKEQTDDGDDDTDYTDGSSDDDDSDDNYSEDDGEVSPDDSNDDQPSDDNPDEQTGQSDDIVKNKLLIDDYQKFYEILKNNIKKLSNADKSNIFVNKIVSQVSSNLISLQDAVYNFITVRFNNNKYAENLYQYNLFLQACQINVEMLKKINDFNSNTKTNI